MKELQQYLKDTFGVFVKPVSDKKADHKLPLYLRGNFEIYPGNLSGHKIVWAKLRDESNMTPDQLQKQGYQLKEYLHAPIVFVFKNLETWQRKRLIEKKVGFAELFKQLYIPELLVQIKDPLRKENSFAPASKKLKPPAQCLLLYHLQVHSLEEKLFQEIARVMNYSAMTVSRAVKELTGFQLLTVSGNKEKSVRFHFKGRELWEKALPFLESPVREVWYCDVPAINDYLRFSGETALAVYTMLSGSEQQCYAISKDTFRLTKASLTGVNNEYGNHKLEVWHYDPVLLTHSGEVDRLSLYLSMQEDDDERVQGALRNLLNEMKW